MPCRDTVAWTAMVSAYAQNGHVSSARNLFHEMPEKNLVVISWNAMAIALAESGDLSSAKILFDRIPERNSVSWNAMIQGYTVSGDWIAAMEVFDRMPQLDVISFTTIVAAIAQGGDLDRARVLFDAMPERNLVSWNAMMAGYAQNGDPSSAMVLLKLLDQDGLRPNAITFVVALDSCANLAALAQGKLLLAEISLLQDELCQSIELGNAAINLLGKCGQLDQARQLFDSWNTGRGDAVAWNTTIAAYAQNGMGRDAMELFTAMNLEGVEVDDVTLLSVLASTSGSDAIQFFHSIAADYRCAHSREHFLCLADALGRWGKLREALAVILTMPYAPNLIAWTTLLSACKGHADVEIGEEAARRASELWPESPAPYIALSSIYAARFFKS
ncbi:hypothetical protein SELMODRAFT_91690 [Selaginella moellendorffii]|uniref:Pentacotripeptide-repeat region of PRORP domain-containing protein n=1 Tax=Selaginella moellendorffii TaxID=88036 RepID=D8RER8_SELML|nr:hypothetical protein SELMODRAFT_91690 [Selaginella moellendorffii]